MKKKEYLSGLPRELKGALARSGQPAWIQPMLATLTDKRFFEEGWIYEPKLDGMRCLAFKQGRRGAALHQEQKLPQRPPPRYSRGAAEGSPRSEFVLDGEIVAFEGERSNFAFLQKGRKGVNIYYYVFDILHFEGYDLTRIPLVGRKALLEQALTFESPIRFLSPIVRGRRRFLQRSVRQRVGGAHRQAGGEPLRLRALGRLAQVQVHQPAGIRRRGIHGSGRGQERVRLPAPRILRGREPQVCRQGGDGLQPAGLGGSLRGSCHERRGPGLRSLTKSTPGACTGSSRSWSPRSASANGRGTAGCAIRGS